MIGDPAPHDPQPPSNTNGVKKTTEKGMLNNPKDKSCNAITPAIIAVTKVAPLQTRANNLVFLPIGKK